MFRFSRRIRIALPFGLTILSLLAILYYTANSSSHLEQFQQNSSILNNKQLQISKVEELQDSIEKEQALLKLGLTPHHSIQIQTLNQEDGTTIRSQTIHGRFLHLTDLHPDELNIVGGAIEEQCHRKVKGTSKDDRSHEFGDAMSGCDSPMALYKDTLTWIKENLKDKIDFVVWTGDNIRHDNDRRHPRSEMDIFDMNREVADLITQTFRDDDEDDLMPIDRRVSVIPSLGNNDVYPHNLFAPGPTLQTREMYQIWRNFIPSEQMHVFDRGVYFFKEVIPGKLAVLSINTLYFFIKNPLNDNCDSRKQPGYKLFEWLGYTLKELRRRNIKVWFIGHVPPNPKNLHFSCYTKMSVWLHEYRDIIIGGLYGHMNIDHFFPLDSVKSWKSIQTRLQLEGLITEAAALNFTSYDDDLEEENDLLNDLELYRAMNLIDGDELSVQGNSKRYESAPQGKVSYLEEVRDLMFSTIKGPGKAGLLGERYSFAHVTASVIPTFNPGLRVWEYNITTLFQNEEEQLHQQSFESWDVFFENLEKELSLSDEIVEMLETFAEDDPIHKEYLTPTRDKTIPPIMPADLPLGPGYVAQLFSPERYTQYFLDLKSAGKVADWKLEYEVQYSTDDDQYEMDGLLVNDWIKLARKLSKAGADPNRKNGKDKKNKKAKLLNEKEIDLYENEDGVVEIETAKKLWNSYIDRAFISSGYQHFDFARDDE